MNEISIQTGNLTRHVSSEAVGSHEVTAGAMTPRPGRVIDASESPNVAGLMPETPFDALRERATGLGMQVLLASPEDRAGVVAAAKELEAELRGTTLHEIYAPTLKNAEDGLAKGDKNRLDAIIELLTMMAMLLGMTQTSRREASGRAGEVASDMTVLSNNKAISAEVSALSGAAVGFVSSVAVSGVGARQIHSANARQVTNLDTNVRKANELSMMSRDARTALRAPGTAGDASPQRQLNKVTGEGGQADVAPSENALTQQEHDVIAQSLDNAAARAENLRVVGDQNSFKFNSQLATGQAISAQAQAVSGLAQSSGGLDAAHKRAESNLAAAASRAMESIQSGDAELSSRLLEKLLHIFSLTNNLQASSIGLLSSLMPTKG
ncbi:invasin protein C (IpaC_SipC) [Cupriavidus sp. YR651]|uniref:IpaC/SipC family type III secretion system effector n=1 Tax=Cupriavidus sp. YR651 TaxID=1855315 RepID=UPI000886E721|nr:IpaC/SipC family type III secretion system effector [Cupriavidus sp. YR651]SDD38457.1 invasin protein C (IpaC_SipC) [Cupriavidus sp. YR651]